MQATDIDIKKELKKRLKRDKKVDMIVDEMRRNIPNDLREYLGFQLQELMNSECLSCHYCKINSGQYFGKIGGNPCLIFDKEN